MSAQRVVILTRDGVEVASAICNFTVRKSSVGMTSWRGTLAQIEPQRTVQPEEYRLRLSTGEEGDIIVTKIRPILRGLRYLGDAATFQGTGPPPGRDDANRAN